MTNDIHRLLQAVVVGQDCHLSLIELAQACGTTTERLIVLVQEGVLEPAGGLEPDWTFDDRALRRARLAVRFIDELHVNEPGVGLALDLLDEIDQLRRELGRLRIG